MREEFAGDEQEIGPMLTFDVVKRGRGADCTWSYGVELPLRGGEMREGKSEVKEGRAGGLEVFVLFNSWELPLKNEAFSSQMQCQL